MRQGLFLFVLFAALRLSVSGQTTFPENGVKESTHNFVAFTNAMIHLNPDQLISKGTLLIKDGVIKEVGKAVSIPSNTVVYDLKGKHIYPSFIDLYSSYGMPNAVDKSEGRGRRTQLFGDVKNAGNWNDQIHPQTEAVTMFEVNDSQAAEYRAIGFGALLSHQMDGIVRGTSTLVLTGDKKPNEMIVKNHVAMQMAFSRGKTNQVYPTSLMGMLALIRQSNYDAQWYATQPAGHKEYNASLEALVQFKSLPQIYDAVDGLSISRAAKIAKEFQQEAIICGTTDAYRYVNDIKESQFPLIIPVNFPKAYDISSPYEELDVSLEQMKHWEMAPFNAKILINAGIDLALTSEGLKKKANFLVALRKMKKEGMKESEILRSLTQNPARFIHQEANLGDLSKGKLANFFISSGSIFETDEFILENWVKGERYPVKNEEIDIRGNYNLSVGKEKFQINISGKRHQPEAEIPDKNSKSKVKIDYSENLISLSFTIGEKNNKELYRLDGFINDEESRIWAGKAVLQNGEWVDWAAIRQSDYVQKAKDSVPQKDVTVPIMWYPNQAYGFDSLPSQETVIFQNATIWTNLDTGILLHSDIAISEGKIIAIGKSLTRVGLFGNKDIEVKLINARGKHITAGIIDEHSHIAVSRGVNEAGWNNSAEVRIGDVINPEDINIYRQLAGGVVAAQLLHGSANPIGGQSALVKLRWGRSADEMKIKDADGFIKFALGENVKQSNWGDDNKTRFPQTRMGVEQVYFDAFIRAKEYKENRSLSQLSQQNKRKKENSVLSRRDLRLEALAEILDSNRFITCHSYIQSEINMLMHVADSMGFKVNTFTHVLEGYKVADKIKKHGAGASTFSDWWAYKFEVNDAIPYNGAILQEQGVLTAFNSDDAEMGRRLNQEAAKAVKYGNMSEEEAWKLVTLNPAKMLHLDHRTGSLAVGMDADIVLWSAHPLSIQARAEQTYVDGICYYDHERNESLIQRDLAERARLVKKMAATGTKTEELQKASKKPPQYNHCDIIESDL